MNPMADILVLVISTAFSIYIMLVWLRFLLQLVRADFYNPISQFVVKATTPVLHPMRRLIPSIGGTDTASLLLIVLLQMIQLVVINKISGGNGYPLPYLFMYTLYSLLMMAATFYFWLLLISVVMSWIAQGNSNPATSLVHQLTEPMLAPLRRLLPAMGGLDLSPIIAFLVIKIFEILVMTAFKPLLGLG